MADKPSTEKLTRPELASALRCHPMTVTKWEREGMPIAVPGARGRSTLYVLDDVRRWLEAREHQRLLQQPSGVVDLVAERARKERAQAMEAEQRVAARSRVLLPRDEVERAWAAEATAIRGLLLSWSTTLADRVHRAAVTEGVVGVETVLQEAVRDVLRQLSDPTRPLPGDEAVS